MTSLQAELRAILAEDRQFHTKERKRINDERYDIQFHSAFPAKSDLYERGLIAASTSCLF